MSVKIPNGTNHSLAAESQPHQDWVCNKCTHRNPYYFSYCNCSNDVHPKLNRVRTISVAASAAVAAATVAAVDKVRAEQESTEQPNDRHGPRQPPLLQSGYRSDVKVKLQPIGRGVVPFHNEYSLTEEVSRELLTLRRHSNNLLLPRVGDEMNMPFLFAECERQCVSQSTLGTVAFVEDQGRALSMSDRLVLNGYFQSRPSQDFYAIFSGNNGHTAAHIAYERFASVVSTHLFEQASEIDIIRALHVAMYDVHSMILRNPSCNLSGAAALTMLRSRNRLFFANLGDCRALLLNRDGSIEQVTRDHYPFIEREMVQVMSRGGTVSDGLVNRQSRISRALGNQDVASVISHEPDIFFRSIDCVRSIVMACGEVWRKIGNDAVVEIVRRSANLDQAVVNLRNVALNKGAQENISIIMIDFLS